MIHRLLRFDATTLLKHEHVTAGFETQHLALNRRSELLADVHSSAMWWWRKVRKANIPSDDRDIFERFGETVIGTVLAGGYTPRAMELQAIYRDGLKQGSARDWLTERADLHERREDRLETAEWAVLIFVIVGVAVDGLLFFR